MVDSLIFMPLNPGVAVENNNSKGKHDRQGKNKTCNLINLQHFGKLQNNSK